MSDKPGPSTAARVDITDVDKDKTIARGYAVIPLKNCPHLIQVPESGINFNTPCQTCQDLTENWICLICYTVNCSRFVQAHANQHFENNDHAIALSFSDLTAWCYKCESYVHNDVLTSAKNSLYESKFGTK